MAQTHGQLTIYRCSERQTARGMNTCYVNRIQFGDRIDNNSIFYKQIDPNMCNVYVEHTWRDYLQNKQSKLILMNFSVFGSEWNLERKKNSHDFAIKLK